MNAPPVPRRGKKFNHIVITIMLKNFGRGGTGCQDRGRGSRLLKMVR